MDHSQELANGIRHLLTQMQQMSGAAINTALAPYTAGGKMKGSAVGPGIPPGSIDATGIANGNVLTAFGGVGIWAPGASGGALTHAVASLGADVALTTAGTFYDGPSLSLAAGTWLALSVVEYLISSASSFLTSRLWDGTTTYAELQTQSTYWTAHALSAIVTLAATTTLKVSATPDTTTGNTMKAKAGYHGAGGTLASYLAAVKIG